MWRRALQICTNQVAASCMNQSEVTISRDAKITTTFEIVSKPISTLLNPVQFLSVFFILMQERTYHTHIGPLNTELYKARLVNAALYKNPPTTRLKKVRLCTFFMQHYSHFFCFCNSSSGQRSIMKQSLKYLLEYSDGSSVKHA